MSIVEKAQKLWQDPFLLRVPLKYEAERYLFIGKIEQKHRSAIATYREKAIRIISVRTRKEEVKVYENQ